MLPRSYYNEEDARKRQIDTLKVFNEHVTEVTEDAEYRVDFSVGSKNMSLTVVLSPEFPNEQPTIFVNPTVPHPWLAENSNQVIGAPGLLNYTQHSDLGRVVQAITRELQRSVPTLEDGQHPSATSLMFPELSELTVEELGEVLENTDIQVTEDAEYRVDFSVGSKNMSLTVVLSPEFPNEQPTIFVNPTVPHPWLAENSNQVIGAPGLLNYTQHSDLGRVVQAITRELQRSVPTLEDGQHPSATSLMFPELSELTVEELGEVLENTDIQDRLLESNPQLTELDAKTEAVLASIAEIARDNLGQQRLLDELKTEVVERISNTVQMKLNYEELNRKHQKLAEMYDPHRIRDCLKEAALKADEDAEMIAEQFLLGTIPVETFVTKFAEKRALGQARRAREERLAHQLSQLDRATT